MKLLNWNLKWATLRSARAPAIQSEIAAQTPDVICLTEANAALLPAGGEIIESEPDYGYGVQRTRRKVLLWARDGFSNVRSTSPPNMPPGRFVSAVTRAHGVRVVGVCIPWFGAHVSTGRHDRRPWEDHLAYIQTFENYLESLNGARCCVVGDFNQTLPRTRAPRYAHEALLKAFAGFEIATASRLTTPRLLDHLALSPRLSLGDWHTLPVLSDHTGWIGDVEVS